MHCCARLLHHNLLLLIPPPKPLLSPSSSITNSSSTPILRRNLTTSSLLLLFLTPHPSTAQTQPPPPPTTRAFLDISIDGKPIGRIIIALYTDDVPAGSATFSTLVTGKAGVSYRRKVFVKIMPNYVQHGGLRSYGVDVELARRTGRSLPVDSLVSEWKKQKDSCQGTKNVAKSVSIIVRDPSKPPPKMKLVARKGKLEIDEEEMGSDPNGTEFVIVAKDSPELDAAALVVGTVVEGMDVVERIEQVKTVQENSTSPYFRIF
ncbi:hypothetical protein ACS0TY_024337 [Phlomoides rotata]